MEITNKTKKPLSISLGSGKKLFLGPGKSGQITRSVAERPAVVKLVDAGEAEIIDKGSKQQSGGSSNTNVSRSGGSRHSGSGAMRQSGDK